MLNTAHDDKTFNFEGCLVSFRFAKNLQVKVNKVINTGVV